MSNDLNSELTTVNLVPNVTGVNTDANGTALDIKDYVGTAKVILSADNEGGTSPTLDVKIQDSPDNSTWTDVTGAAFTQITNAASLQNIALDTRAVARYIRTNSDFGGTVDVNYTYAVLFTGRKQVS